MSSESPQKVSPVSPDKKPDRRRKSSVKSEASSQPDSLSARNIAPSKPESPESSPLPILLPTKCKPKTDSDSDSDSTRSTKSSTSSTSKVSKVFKKTFKGKAIAIVKPFSPATAVTEKRSSPNEKQKEIEERADLYEFGSEQESDESNLNKESLQDPSSDTVSLSLSKSSSAVSSLKGIKRLKSGRQASLSSRRLKSSPELKSVRVRVEKLRNSPGSSPPVKSDKNKVRQHSVEASDSLAQSELNQLEKSPSSEKEAPSSCSQSESSSGSSPAPDTAPEEQKSLDKVFSDCDTQSQSPGQGQSGEAEVEGAEQREVLACKLEEESGDSQSQSGDSVKLASSGGDQAVKDEKIRDLFSEPHHPVKKEPVKLEKSDRDRNEDSCSLPRAR